MIPALFGRQSDPAWSAEPGAVTQAIVEHGGDLYRLWHPSHGIDVNDAILAATAAATGGKIYTQSLKRYPMPDVAVLKGW